MNKKYLNQLNLGTLQITKEKIFFKSRGITNDEEKIFESIKSGGITNDEEENILIN